MLKYFSSSLLRNISKSIFESEVHEKGDKEKGTKIMMIHSFTIHPSYIQRGKAELSLKAFYCNSSNKGLLIQARCPPSNKQRDSPEPQINSSQMPVKAPPDMQTQMPPCNGQKPSDCAAPARSVYKNRPKPKKSKIHVHETRKVKSCRF